MLKFKLLLPKTLSIFSVRSPHSFQKNSNQLKICITYLDKKDKSLKLGKGGLTVVSMNCQHLFCFF